jgi:hypothetical protein
VTAPIRPMTHDDLPQVASLYELVSRSGSRDAAPGLADYFGRTLLNSPWFDSELPSLVYEKPDGEIVGFIGSHVRRMRLDGRELRLGCCGQLVTEPQARNLAVGAFLLRAYMAGPQDVTITDTASDVVRRMWESLSGVTMHLQCVAWLRLFRPLRYATGRVTKGTVSRSAVTVARPLTAALDAMTPGLRPRRSSLHGEDLTPSSLVANLPVITDGLRLHPDYDEPYLAWLFRELAAVRTRGDLVGRLVRDEEDRVLGWYVYYLKRGGVSQVLQIATKEREAGRVVDDLFRHASASGSAALQGRLEPHLREPLATRRCYLHSTGNRSLVAARDPVILDAIAFGGALLTRLEGEWWMGHHLELGPSRS